MKQQQAVYQLLTDGKKKFAPLIDPDKYTPEGIRKVAGLCAKAKLPFILYGGSLITSGNHENYLDLLKNNCPSKIILFPGNNLHISKNADAILLLSLISGRNPELLIGRHVVAAPILKASGIEIIPTGYMLIDGSRPTAVTYMSNTIPIPGDKHDIAACTAMAGEMLGLRLIYMDAGSGAAEPVSEEMTAKVKESIQSPLAIGGGIKTLSKAKALLSSGADIVVIGNALEKDPDLILKMAEIIG